MSHVVVLDAYPCAFCDYLSGARPYTILHREEDAAISSPVSSAEPPTFWW